LRHILFVFTLASAVLLTPEARLHLFYEGVEPTLGFVPEN